MSGYTPSAAAQPIGGDLTKPRAQRRSKLKRSAVLADEEESGKGRRSAHGQVPTTAGVQDGASNSVQATLVAMKALLAQMDDDRKAKNLTQVLESHRSATEAGMKSIVSGMSSAIDSAAAGAAMHSETSDSQTAAVLRSIRTQLWILGGLLIVAIVSLVIFVAARRARP